MGIAAGLGSGGRADSVSPAARGPDRRVVDPWFSALDGALYAPLWEHLRVVVVSNLFFVPIRTRHVAGYRRAQRSQRRVVVPPPSSKW